MIRVLIGLSILMCLAACAGESDRADDLAALKGAPQPSATAPSPEVVEVDWQARGTCEDQLRELLRLSAGGTRIDSASLPFAVVNDTAPAVPLRADLDVPVERSAHASAPCLLRVGPAQDVESRRRIVGKEAVESEYQKGTRQEDNPEYALAKARVDMAKRRASYDDDMWNPVGDPMIDLVGVLVGSIVEGFSEGASEGDLNEAMVALAKTPRKIDQPVYTSYHFERVIVEAARRGTIPVELIDRRHGTSNRTAIRHVEQRRFHIPQGLNKRDRNFAEHSAEAISSSDLKSWLRSPPELALSQIARAVLDEPVGSLAASPAAGPAFAGRDPAAADEDSPWATASAAAMPVTTASGGTDRPTPLGVDNGELPGASGSSRAQPLAARTDTGIDGGWQAPYALRTSHARDRQAADLSADPRFASVVVIKGESSLGSGFYVAPNVVVTNHHVVDGANMVDVTSLDGRTVMAMVAASDVGRDLALIHTPDPGQPAPLYAGAELRPGTTVDAIGSPHGHDFTLTRGIVSAVRTRPSLLVPGMQNVRYIQTDAAINNGNSGGPLFLGDEVVGISDWAEQDAVSGGLNFAIHIDELKAFLAEEGLAQLPEPDRLSAGNG